MIYESVRVLNEIGISTSMTLLEQEGERSQVSKLVKLRLLKDNNMYLSPKQSGQVERDLI